MMIFIIFLNVYFQNKEKRIEKKRQLGTTSSAIGIEIESLEFVEK